MTPSLLHKMSQIKGMKKLGFKNDPLPPFRTKVLNFALYFFWRRPLKGWIGWGWWKNLSIYLHLWYDHLRKVEEFMIMKFVNLDDKRWQIDILLHSSLSWQQAGKRWICFTTIKSRKLKSEKLFNAFRSEIETGFSDVERNTSIHIT